MTPTENAALQEVRAILRLHFDAFVITTRVRDDDDTERVNSDWHGSLADVMGMNRITAVRLDQIAIKGSGAPDIT